MRSPFFDKGPITLRFIGVSTELNSSSVYVKDFLMIEKETKNHKGKKQKKNSNYWPDE